MNNVSYLPQSYTVQECIGCNSDLFYLARTDFGLIAICSNCESAIDQLSCGAKLFNDCECPNDN